MARQRILVVEDDLHVVQGLLAGLRGAGFDVDVAMDGERGVTEALRADIDLVVLDLMLPGQHGYDVLEALAGRTSVPVIVLSARTELPSRLGSFARGAVDFVGKPFFIEELVARIHARLGAPAATPQHVRFGDTVVELDARRAVRAGHDVGLTPIEFNVLSWLVLRPGRAVSREQLALHALGPDGPRDHRTVDSHVSRVRRKLGDDGAHLHTVWGLGYRFEAP